MRVLLTGVGGPAGRALADQLLARGHWVGGTDLRDVGTGLDAFARVCPVSDAGYLPALVDLARDWGVDALIPSISEELVLLARSRDHLPAPVLIGEPEAVAIADDKLLTAARLDRAGVAVPRFAVPSAFRSASDAIAEVGGPIIVKPRVSRGGRGVWLIEEHEARGRTADAFWESLDDASIVQEFGNRVRTGAVPRG